jgi:cation:H+ antiporter
MGSVIHMFTSFSFSLLISLFVIAAGIVWVAAIQLSKTTAVIDSRFGFGQALGGMIFLAIATSLPEIAIVTSAALTHHVDIAIGNILGGIAIQTVILVLLDGFGSGRKAALTYEAASLQLILEGVLVICVLVIAIMGMQLPKFAILGRVAPGDLLIVVAWLIGVWLINKARNGLPWHKKGYAQDAPHPIETASQKKMKKCP